MDLKELEKFLKICRKQGVTDITWNGVTVKFGDLPARKQGAVEEPADEESDELTPEQLLFYSAQGIAP
jgi:hypothetical protein